MKIVFWASEKARERELANAFVQGAKRHGIEAVRVNTGAPFPKGKYDYACMVGVKSAELWKQELERGVTPIMFDKGYVRVKHGQAWLYWRVSVGSHTPYETLMREYPSDRWDQLGLTPRPWRKQGTHIVIAGSSAKYHRFHDLPHPNEYTKAIVKRLQAQTTQDIFYRPKPSWRDAVPIAGTTYSVGPRSLQDDLQGAWALVTHGSNACFDAAMMGIPSIILGGGVMKPISSTSLKELRTVKTEDRKDLFNAIAYHQWTLDEFRSGEALKTIRTWL